MAGYASHVYSVIVGIVQYAVSIYKAENTFNKINWKRVTDLVTVGLLSDNDTFDKVKIKCAQNFDLEADREDIILLHAGARVDQSAFSSLGQFLSTISPQQRAKCSIGVGVETHVGVHPCIKPTFIIFGVCLLTAYMSKRSMRSSSSLRSYSRSSFSQSRSRWRSPHSRSSVTSVHRQLRSMLYN